MDNFINVFNAIQLHWEVFLAIIVVLAKIANACTRHWPEWSKGVRWLGFLVEVLDIIRVPELRRKNDGKSNEGKNSEGEETGSEVAGATEARSEMGN